VAEITKGKGVDFAVDAVGDPRVFRQMLESLGIRGHGALVGAPAPGHEVAIDLSPSLGKGQRISMVLEGDSQPQLFIPQLVRLMDAGLLPVEELITTYPFASINDAAADAARGVAVKPVLLF
jgi:aryl-alcohol dehydrogenase